jgi:large repetitive protein
MSNEQSLVFSVNNQLYPNQIIPTSPGIYGANLLSEISQNSLYQPFVSGQLPFLATDGSNNLLINNLICNSVGKSSELNLFKSNAVNSAEIDPLRQNIATSLQKVPSLKQSEFNNQLTTTISLAQEKISSFFKQPEVEIQLALAFGQGIDADLAKNVSQKLPNIQVVEDSILGQANGAYALTSNTIFLSQSLVERGDQQEIVAVLLEEIGHSIDGYLNTQDSTGDEGEIFAKLVNGQVNSENYQPMLTEDDHNQIIWNGQVLAVENYVVSQPIHGFTIQAGGQVITNGSSDFDGNPLNVNDDAFIYAGKGFDLNGQTILPVQRNQAGNALTNSSGQLLLVDQAVVVAPGYLISASNGSNNYTNLNPPQVIAQQTITIPSYAGIKQQELAARIPVGATTVVLNVSPSPMNNANQWQQMFPTVGTANQPRVVRVLNGSLNIPNNVDLSNYVILVENGDITLGSNNKLTNVTLLATNVYFKNNQVINSSILAANSISGNSKISFTGKNLLATGQGNVTLNGTTTGLDSAQNLRIASQGQITLNGSVTARGEFRSVGNFLVNGSSDIYGTITTLQDVRFNGNSTFTYANTGSNNPPPNVPTIQLQASSDTGISNSDQITANSTPVIIGMGDVGATIKLVDNGTVIGQTTVGADGKWQITTSPLIDGNHPLTVSAINSTGIASAASAPLQVMIDTVIALPTLNLALPSDSGTVGDYRTKAAIVNLNGKTEANAKVTLSGNPTPVTSDAQGNFTFTNVALNPQANSFTVTATDIAGNSKSYTQTIYRTSAPTAVNLNTPQVLENSTNGLLVGNLSTINSDGVDNYVYSLVDNAGGRFKLAGNQILVDNSSLLDFEANQQHQIQVRTTDSEGDNFLQTIAIQVRNVNETPTSLTLSNSTIAENLPGGSLIGNLSSTDPDQGDTSSFSLVTGTGDLDNSKFSVIDRQLVINQSPNFEAKNSYSIRLRVTDAGGLTLDRAFNISVTDVNEAPISIGLSSQVIAENSSNTTVIGTFITLDPDASDIANYQLIDNANGRFAIVGNELRVANGSLLDFEAGKEHQIKVTSTDQGGLQVTQTFTIQIANVNEAPLDLTLSNNLVSENSTLVGSLSTIDPDALDTHTYSLVTGAGDIDNNAFTITNNQLRFQVAPNFEAKSNYGLRIRTTDAGGLSLEKQLTVTVANVNEAPTQLILDINQVSENSSIGTLVGKFSSLDPDAGGSHVYTLVTGNGAQDNSKFSIVNNELRLNFVPDFETQAVYYLRVQTQDVGGLTWQQELTVNILDVIESQNHAPTGISLNNSSITENSPNNTLIAKLGTTDLDVGNTHTYTLLNNAGGRFKRVGDELRVADGALLDFETATSHQIRIRTTDDGTPSLAYEQDVTIRVTNVNEAPLFTSEPLKKATVGAVYSYRMNTTDPEGDVRSISALNLPAWLNLEDNGDGTATLSGTPTIGDLGINKVQLTVTDAGGLKSTQTSFVSVGALLEEKSLFNSELSTTLVVPNQPSTLQFKIDTGFDRTDLDSIKDAFEVDLVGADGKSLVHTIGSGKRSFFNWTEGLNPDMAAGVTFDPATKVVSINLAGIAPGTAAKLLFHLVNNDGDIATQVNLESIQLVAAPAGTSSPVQSGQNQTFQFETLPTAIFAQMQDVSPSLQVQYGQTTFNDATNLLYADISLKNIGSYAVNSPLVVAIKNISDPTVLLRSPDGFTPERLPYYNFSSLVSDGNLNQGEETLSRSLIFSNPKGVQFTYEAVLLSIINEDPTIQTKPVLEVVSGKLYQYDVDAIDPNNDTLTYKLITAPIGMTVDQVTGKISWDTQNSDLGNHVVSMEVSDGRGGTKRQTYNLSVIETPPNRPPIFTSIPEVDAYVNQLYQYDANAVDPDEDNPLSFTLISGPDGMKVNSTTGVVNWTPDATLILGDTVLGRIGSPGENDEFTFSGSVGQRIYFDPIQYSDVNKLVFNIYDPKNVLITRASFNYNDSRLITLVENGNYKIVVDGVGDGVANYGFRIIDPSLVPIAEFDTVVKGKLSTGNEDDLYRFTGNKGQKLFFDQIGSAAGVLGWVLYGPDNSAVSSSAFQDMEVDLTTSGEYVLAIRGNAGFTNVVDYTFSIIAPELKDFDLPLNQVVSGTIVKKGEQDSYYFTGQAGQQIFFDALGGNQLYCRLYDPTGRILTDAIDNRADRSPGQGFIFSMDGTYKLVIDGLGENTGSYKFRLLDKANATEILFDTDITGTFDNGGLGSVGYRFTLSDSQYVFLDGQGGNGQWNIYNSNGQNARNGSMQGNSEFQLEAGNYFLVASGNGGTNPNYKFRMITPEFNIAPLIFGDIISGSLAEKGEQDIYTFVGNAGQQIFLDGLGGDNLFTKAIDPTGRTIINLDATYDRARNHIFTLPMNGIYRLIIDGYDETVGNYKLRLLDKAQATEISLDTDITGTFDQGGLGSVTYRFTVSDSQYLFIDGQGGNGKWEIYNLADQAIFSASMLANSEFRLDAGDYFLVATGNGGGDTNYKFRMITPEFNTTPLLFGEVISGSIVEKGEQDIYTFNGTAGQQFFFDSLSSSSLQVKLLDFSNREIASFAANNDRETFGTLIIPVTGAYRIIVDGADETVGNYKFRLLDRAAATVVSFNTDITGTFDNDGQGSVGYRFSLTDSHRLLFDGQGGNGKWILYGINGRYITQNNLSSDLERWLEEGDYFIVAQGQGSVNSDFKFKISDLETRAANPLVGTQISLSAEIADTSIAPYGPKTYLFNGVAGQQIFFDSLAGSFGAYSLLDSTGGQVARYTYGAWVIPVTGVYSLKVEYTVGSYKFRLLESSQATEIALDTDTTGIFDNGGFGSKLYRFSLSSGQSIFFDGQGGNGQWELYGANGEQVATTPMSQNKELSLNAGDYFLVASGSGGGNTNYKFRIITPEFNTVPMTVGSTISGNILEKGEQDTYTFVGTAGQQLFFDGLGGDNLVTKVVDPTGKTILNLDATYDRAPNAAFALSISGTYRLIIDGSDENIGSYKFRLLDKAQASEIALDTDIIGTFDNGGLGSVGYRFTLNESRYLFIDGQGGSGNWEIYSPNGQRLHTNTMSLNGEFWLNAGEYFLVANGNGGGNVNYKFRIVAPELNVVPLGFGDTVSGTLTKKGEYDTYSFNGTAGQHLFFDSLGGDYFLAKLIDPSGREIVNFDSRYDRGPGAEIPLSVTGVYRLVFDVADENIGSYKFRLLDKAQASVVALDTDISGTFDNGGLGSAVYRFSVSEKQYLYIDRLAGNGSLYIYNSSGQPVVNQSLASDVEKEFLAGEYFMVLSGQGASSTNYHIRLGTPELQTTAMTLGEVINTTISEKGEQDFYTFTGAEGQRLLLDELRSYSGISFTLISPSGKGVPNLYLGSQPIPVTLSEAGTYRVVIDSFGELTGNYSFRLLDLEDAISLEMGANISGQLNLGFETQLYKFPGSEGSRLYFDTLSTTYASWVLYGPSNQIVTESTYFTDKEVVLPSSGNYILSIRNSLDSPCNYQFQVIAAGESITDLNLGQLTAGTVLLQGERDAFTFNGGIGQQIFFDVVSGNSTIHAQLFSPAGVLMADLSSSANAVAVTLTEQGDYKILVDGYDSGTGDYSLLVSDHIKATNITLDTPINGQLEADGTPQLFTIKGNVGQFLKFDINDADTSKVQWVLFGDGNQELKRTFGGVNDFNLMLPSSGTHTLAVYNRGTTQANYQFVVTDITPAQVATTGLDTLVGETAFTARSGQITAGQVVEQTFTASAGKRIFLDSLDFDDSNVIITILNPNGTVLLTSSASQDAITQLSQSGTYRIRVQGATPTSVGDYRFSVFEVLNAAPAFNDDARTLTLNAEITKTLDYGHSTHILSFQGTAGQRLFYDGMLPDGLNFNYANISAKLIRPNGETVDIINQYDKTIAASQDSLPIILTSSGTYNLMIVGNQDAPATYRFKMWDLSKVEPLKLNKLYGDNLQRGSDSNFYQIQGEAGKRLYFNAISGRSSDRWVLYRWSDRQAVQTVPFSQDFEYVLPDNGQYVLAIQGNSTAPGLVDGQNFNKTNLSH